MKKIQRLALTVLTLSTLSFVAVGCTTTGSTSGEAFHKVDGASHRADHPDGHSPKKGHSCFYNTAEDVFFCSF